MPAARTNFLVVYKNSSQIYGSSSEKIALESPPPDGADIEDKRILFITYRPDTEELVVHPLPHEDVVNAELKYPKPKKKKEETTDE